MPVNTGRKPTRFKVKVISPNAPDIVRMVHANITDNHRKFRTARVNLPPIVSRSVMIVAQERLMPIRIAEE
jgi:hypothetical protein